MWQFMASGDTPTPKPASWVWIGFLIGLPVLLTALISLHLRLTAMLVVMYATIGLALDIATFVQEMSRPKGGMMVVCAALLSATINFLLVACGGQAVLGGKSGEQLEVTRRPNPPSPLSS
jgi:hypothetical protein